MERAVPSIIRIADWMFPAFRSASFSCAIAWTCSLVIVPTLFVFGSPDPFSMPAASRMRTAAGDDLTSKSNDRSL